VASLNNIALVFVPILSYYVVNNHTFDVGLKQAGSILFGTGYSIGLDSIHLNTLDGFEQKQIVFIPGTDTVKILFSGININSDVNGKACLTYSYSVSSFLPDITFDLLCF
jgi:hypothetical protein